VKTPVCPAPHTRGVRARDTMPAGTMAAVCLTAGLFLQGAESLVVTRRAMIDAAAGGSAAALALSRPTHAAAAEAVATLPPSTIATIEAGLPVILPNWLPAAEVRGCS
jgi:hypothetical protein